MSRRLIESSCRAGVVAGAALAIAGLALWWVPAALMVGGLALAGASLLALGVRP